VNTYSRYKFLVVEDDTPSMQLVVQTLKTMGITSILTATNGEEALNTLRSNKVDLIISDWNMPKMGGLELFKAGKKGKLLSNTPFLIVSAVNQKEKVVESLNAGIDAYILKPFSIPIFTDKIKQLLEQKHIKSLPSKLKIKDLIEKKVASPPEVYIRLQNVLDKKGHTFEDIADVIQSDASLCARLLMLVNSAAYSFEHQIVSIQQALSVLGTRKLSHLVLSTTVQEVFHRVPKDFVDMQSFWKYNLTCAMAARIIATMKNETDAELFYLAGLLHDIGSLIIYNELPQQAKEVIELCATTEQQLYLIENKILGFNHAELGGALLEEWMLPNEIQEAVKFHHTPLSAKKFPLIAKIIHLADIVSHNITMEDSGEASATPMAPNILEHLNLTEKDLDAIQIEAEKLASSIFTSFEN
jgi:putative nucleotidyltransferase with HDIG domain